ncbi:MAG: MliC family protein [Gammaproteobacteria bacterium]|nr:MliC family protein [Gammaproteobacteria bacterium]
MAQNTRPPRRTLNLPRVHSASGIRYALGDVVFWSKGDEAVLALGDRHHRDCRNDRSAPTHTCGTRREGSWRARSSRSLTMSVLWHWLQLSYSTNPAQIWLASIHVLILTGQP